MIFQGTTPLPGSEAWNALPAEEQKKIYADYKAFGETPGVEAGLPLGLPSAARTLRVREGKPQVQGGTYLSEGAGGYCVVEAENLEAALAVAAKIPAARLGGAIEVRPVETYW
jgi:hypothetical protein